MGDGQGILSPPQSLRAEQVVATRAAILAAARRLFGTKGYSATSIDDIARDARVTKGAVYHHFETKHELFRSVYAEVEADAQARTARAARPALVARSTSSSKGCTRTSTRRSTPRCSASRSSMHLLCSGPSPTVPRASRPATTAYASSSPQGMKAGAITKLDADALAHVLRGSILQGAMVIADSPDPIAARRRRRCSPRGDDSGSRGALTLFRQRRVRMAPHLLVADLCP